MAAGIPGDLYDRATSTIALNPASNSSISASRNSSGPSGTTRQRGHRHAGQRGRDLIGVNADLFARLQQAYGVPTEVLTAIWGMETGYGANLGGFNLFEALATLAYEGPRATYGRRQLIAALKIALTEDRDPATMTGSWAGAFGFTQFVPTTFLEQAVDGDGDGKRDLWGSHADALASTANYLNHSGWKPGETLGRGSSLPRGLPLRNRRSRHPHADVRLVGEGRAQAERRSSERTQRTSRPRSSCRRARAVRPSSCTKISTRSSNTISPPPTRLAVSVLSDRLKGAIRHRRKLAARRRDAERASAQDLAGRPHHARLRHRRRRRCSRTPHAAAIREYPEVARPSRRRLRDGLAAHARLNERFTSRN